MAENCKFTDTPHPLDRVTGDTVSETDRIDGQGNIVIVTDENAPHFSGNQFNRSPGIERVGQEGVSKSSWDGPGFVSPGRVPTCVAPSTLGNLERKLLTSRRKLLLDMKRLRHELASCKLVDEFDRASLFLEVTRCAYDKFVEGLNNVKDSETLGRLSENMAEQFQQCLRSYEACRSRLYKPHESGLTGTTEIDFDTDNDVKHSDSVSQVSARESKVTKGTSISSNKSSLLRRIELDQKKAELKNMEELTRARARARGKALQAAAAAASAAEAEAQEVEALAKLRMEAIKLDAEERLLACSGEGLSVSGLSGLRSRVRSGFEASSNRAREARSNRSAEYETPGTTHAEKVDPSCALKAVPTVPPGFGLQREESTADMKPFVASDQISKPATTNYYTGTLTEPLPKRNLKPGLEPHVYASRGFGGVPEVGLPTGCFQPVKDEVKTHLPLRQVIVPTVGNSDLILRSYLDRQGRNDYINLASQIRYDGSNMAFVFYENQIRRLMDESPYDERKLEVLRASCVGQPREMVNLFCAPLRSMTTMQRIEKAIDRLRQRYGVSGGVTSEPQVVAVRKGPKVLFNSASLKLFNEDLNTLEVFAHAHNQVEKLSGQLMLDTANRLPNALKRRYLDYLDKMSIDLNQPSFDSLRNFVVHEIGVMTSDYAQAFFKSDEREVAREPSGAKTFRVRQVAVDNGFDSRPVEVEHTSATDEQNQELRFATGQPREARRVNNKSPPVCFVCSRSTCKHYLADCEKFKGLAPEMKRKTVVEAKRCLNCLSLDHFVRQCSFPSKCRLCGPQCRNKHAAALHEYYTFGGSSGAAAGNEPGAPTPAPRNRVKSNGNDRKNVTVRKIRHENNRVVLLRTSAVKVVNPKTGKSALAYAQHDTASQATLISENLKDELGLKAVPDSTVKIRTLADCTVDSGGRTNFVLESLYSGEEFTIKDALVVPEFPNDDHTLPHAVDTAALEHFSGVEFHVVPGRRRIDILIGQSDKTLLTVLDECEGTDPEEPNYVLTRLEPVASGGRILATAHQNSLSSLRVQTTNPGNSVCECSELKKEIVALKETVRQYELDNEVVMSSVSDEMAKELVEPNIKVAVQPSELAPVVKAVAVSHVNVSDGNDIDTLDRLIETSPDLYTLKKRFSYLIVFVEFLVARSRKVPFNKPELNAAFLDHALMKVVKYVQARRFGDVIRPLSQGSPDDFEAVLKRLSQGVATPDNTRRVNELKTLRNLRPCVGPDSLLRVDGRLENAELPIDTKHPIILPARHPLTRLIVLFEHCSAGHAGPSYTLMKARQRYWIIHGISSVKHFIADCSKCALRKAKPIRQLMADLPECRLTLCNKPFKFCGVDYLGPYSFKQGRSVCKAWGLLFTCLCTRCIYVEVVTSLDLNSFLLAFSRFTNLRGAVDTFYSDNGSTFCAASVKLPDLLGSTEFVNALRKSDINWVRIPPYAASQGGS